MYYLHGCIISAFDIAHIELPITDTIIYIVIVDLCFYILLTITILLFYNTHKQKGVSSSQHGIEHSQLDYGVRRSTKSAGSTALIITIMTVLILAFLSVFAWVALVPHHSKTYKECMRSCERQETAIKNAKSLNDMERINNRIIGFTEYESLEGDERVDVYRRHEEVWDLFNERCEQVAVGKYKLVSEEGQTYIVEVTNKIIKDNGFSKQYLVNIYKNNQLHCTGDWGLNGTEIRIFPQFKENTLASISMWPKSNTANTYGWHGNIEEEWNLHNNDGTAEKISEQ